MVGGSKEQFFFCWIVLFDLECSERRALCNIFSAHMADCVTAKHTGSGGGGGGVLWGGNDSMVDVDLADVGRGVGGSELVRVGLWSFPLLRLLSGAALTSTLTSLIMRHEDAL